jgi:tripartite-type tricarboxylate transporter receptor subunit TctC
MKFLGRVFFAILLALIFASRATAQDAAGFPNKPIRIVVAFAAGGGNDIIARIIGQKLSDSLGQPVIIENKPGAGSITGTEYVKNAPPDGHMLLMGATGAMAINHAVYSKLPYDSLKDFAPLSMIARFPLIMVVNPALPVKSVQEVIAYAKANPAKANYGSSSAAFQLVTELFKQKTGAPMEHITYKSTADSILGVITNQVLLTISDMAPATGQIKSGQLRALAVTGKERLADFPDVPTLAEAGIADVEVYLWTGLLAPAATPAPIVQKLEAEIRKAIQHPDVRERLKVLALEPVGGSAEEFRRVIAADRERWSAVAKAANIKIEQ